MPLYINSDGYEYTETQRADVNCPRSPRLEVTGPGFKPWYFASLACAFYLMLHKPLRQMDKWIGRQLGGSQADRQVSRYTHCSTGWLFKSTLCLDRLPC